jgi:tetratricopeptide (TPR) repeat protein
MKRRPKAVLSFILHPSAFILLIAALAGGGYLWIQKRHTTDDRKETFRWSIVQQALDRRDYAQAHDLLSEHLASFPLDAKAHFFLARVERGLEDYDTWNDELRHAGALRWPAEQLRLEASLQRAQAGDLAPVEASLFEYVRTRPAEAVLVYEALAVGYQKSHRYRDLWRLTKAWKQAQPKDWLAWLFAGHALYLDSFAELAIPEYHKALELAPDAGRVQLWLAGAYMDAGRHQQALDIYQAYLAGHADDPNPLFGIANCQAKLGRTEAEHAALAKLLEKDPNHLGGLLLRGTLDLNDGRPEQALSWLRRAESQMPTGTDILNQILRALCDLHRDREAEIYRKKIRDLTQRLTAIMELKTQLRHKPDDVAIRFKIADAYRQIGKRQDAAEWYRSVLSIAPDHEASRRALADLEHR